ncbi:MAG: cysteine--tRNA ligase [Patescibacteria group bacterium]|nr:cysteine--tRNA ligase [Patescibacteria group bacterium]
MIKIYNTLNKQIEEFKPLKSGRVLIYHCGPTVYWTQHIGNLRGMMFGDLLVRTFKYNDYEVKYIRNYTDVGHLSSDEDEGEDKMEKGAKRENKTPLEIAQKYIDIFEKDTKKLNLLEPNTKPRATEYIKEMQAMIQTLINKGFAYETDLAVYFDVSKAKDYSRLSGQSEKDKIEGTGTGDIQDKNKKNPNDFALWFFRTNKHKNALQVWPSTFKSKAVKDGLGFPGWHIECSAMSKKLLSDSIDIHLGGIEHVPVHHTNEIAQSESANGIKYAGYWMHNEHLLVDNGKMSKSEGTNYSLAEIIKKGFDPLVLRFFFLSAQYRSKQNFTWRALLGAKNGLDHLRNQIRQLGEKKGSINSDYKNNFLQAINNDLNTPQALAVVQKLLKSNLNKKDKLATILDFDQVLGLDINKTNDENVPEEAKKLLEKRNKARADKDWTESDRLRTEIEKLGYTIEDLNNKTRVYKTD